jgi:Fe2+-dicitrate sensor, membrane component
MAIPNKFRLKYLLDRCLSKQETEQERLELELYFSDREILDNLDDLLLDSFFQTKELTDMHNERQNQLLHAIYSLEEKEYTLPLKVNYWKWMRFAAIFIAVLGSAIWIGKDNVHRTIVTTNNEQQASSKKKPIEEKIKLDRQPAQKTAILEIGNDTRLDLANLDSGQVFEKNGVTVKQTGDGAILLSFANQLPNAAAAKNILNTVKTPRGGTYKVVLADGTIVQLNSNSKLTFPSQFATNERRVTFEGEGYFEVAKDKTKMFIVTTAVGLKKQEVKVFGTSFNIMAYTDENAIKTTLVEGSVSIKELNSGTEILMKPNELVELGNTGMVKGIADLQAALSWRNNIFYFSNESIQNVLKQISRWYDIDIIYDNNLAETPVWGQMSRSKKLSEVLEILEKTNQLKFNIKGKEVHVNNK